MLSIAAREANIIGIQTGRLALVEAPRTRRGSSRQPSRRRLDGSARGGGLTLR
jgi:hypothetical protein